MADVKNKQVNIYIDQSAAITALEALQKKADGFNQKIDDSRAKQKLLLEQIEKSKAAGGNIDTLKKSYNDLSKEIDDNKKKLADNTEKRKEANTQLKSLNNTLEEAKIKHAALDTEIQKNDSAGKGTVKLKQQFAAVTREIDLTTERLARQTAAFDKASVEVDHYTKELAANKVQQKALTAEIKVGDNAVRTIRNSEKQYQSLNKTIADNTASVHKNADAQKVIQTQMDSGLRPSLNQTKNIVSKLRNELTGMSEDVPGYAEKFKTFEKARTELNRLTQSLNGVEKAQRSWMQDAKTVAFGVLIGNTVQSAVAALGSYLSGIVSGNAKLSDSLADIEKSTGLSSGGVAKLNQELGSLNTRTATSELREIAIGLGQVGEAATKAKVEAIDQIVVALGDEFGGGAREITTSLSVLRNNLQDIKTGNYATDVSRIGNALNVLGAEGLATAPVVSNIANRIAGIGQTFKLTSGQILGVAATFQELGIAEERGSTAIQKLFQKIGAEPEKFAKLTRLSAKEFKDLVNRDMLAAFQQVADGAKRAGGSNVVFSQILKELDADGSGAGEVLSKLGKNADLLADKVDVASQALKETSSITEEFNKKNNTLAGELEKLSKQFNALIQSKTLVDFFKTSVAAAGNFVAALRAIPKYLKENQVAIYLLIAGLTLLNASYLRAGLSLAKKTVTTYLDIVASKIHAFTTNITAAAQATYGLIVEAVADKTKRAALITQFYTIVLKSSLGPLGAVLALAGALAIGLTYLFSRTKELTAAQQKANLELEKSKKINEAWVEVQEDANKQIASTVSRMEKYLKAAEDTTKTDQERKRAIQGIIDINPAYFEGLDLEAVKTGKLREKVTEYTEALKAAAQQKAIFEKRVNLEQQKLDLQQKLDPAEKLTTTTGKEIKLNKTNADGVQLETIGTKLLNQQTKKVIDQIAVVDAQISFLDKKTEELKKKTDNIPGLNKGDETTTNNPFGNDKGDKAGESRRKKEESERKELLKALRDFQFELQQVGKQAEESEIARITKKYEELIGRAKKFGIAFLDLEKEKNRAIAFLQEKELQGKRDKFEKDFLANAKEEYRNSLALSAEYFDDLKDQEADKYGKGLINKRQYEDNIRVIDRESAASQIRTAEDYSATVVDAAKDVNKFKKQLRKSDLKDAIDNIELEAAILKRETLAAARVKVLTTRPGTSDRLDADKNELQVKRDQQLKELEASARNEADIVNEKKRINEEYRQAEAKLTLDFYTSQITQVLGYISQGLDIVSKLNDARSAKENAALKRELKANELKKDSVRKLEETKVISAQEARRRITNIEKEEAAKKEALEKKQFERNKKLQIAQALTNGALAVTKAIAEYAFPFSLIPISFAVASTAASVKEISSKKYGKGGKLKGPSHDEGGMPVINPVTGQKEAEVEGGEYILSKDTVANNKEVADALLDVSMNKGGKKINLPSFGQGGSFSIRPFWEKRPYKSLDYPKVAATMQTVKFATGGIVQQQAPAPAAPVAPVTDPALTEMLSEQQSMNQKLMLTLYNLNNQLAEGITTNFSLAKLDEAKKQQARIKKEADFQ